MKKYLTLLLCSLCALACFSASAESTAGLKDVNVVISTTKGDIELALYPSKAPVTVANFLNLASRGVLQGHHLPPRDSEFHDPGRRSHRHGHGRPRLQF